MVDKRKSRQCREQSMHLTRLYSAVNQFSCGYIVKLSNESYYFVRMLTPHNTFVLIWWRRSVAPWGRTPGWWWHTRPVPRRRSPWGWPIASTRMRRSPPRGGPHLWRSSHLWHHAPWRWGTHPRSRTCQPSRGHARGSHRHPPARSPPDTWTWHNPGSFHHPSLVSRRRPFNC